MKRVDVVYCLITDPLKSKVLIVNNAGNSSWSLPGGAVEQDETLEQDAIREVKEETGLDVNVFGIVAVSECKFKKSGNHAMFFIFRAEIVGGQLEVQRPEEILEIKWVDVEKADECMPFYHGDFKRLMNGVEITFTNEGLK
ncbi:NUDIX hydrolase [Cohnella ginsengisoli]|uniref:NUDIX hydrolase n=1 Tax=Cohnella ginsengisoli TaxID=425004 RepID=A0A9X4QMK1_9BACL|nr:NUDIX hydrolase [Cohnella ginsengisoli]MDG0791436.1 NUDIX hydrolase [Cohnella ginsengisoli]